MVCWEGSGVTGWVAFAVTVVELWTFLSHTCCCAFSCVILLFHLFFLLCFPLPAPPLTSLGFSTPWSLTHSSLSVAWSFLWHCLWLPYSLFPGPLSSSDSCAATGGWVYLPYVSIATRLPLQQLLAAFDKCQKKNFNFCSNSWNYKGQEVSLSSSISSSSWSCWGCNCVRVSDLNGSLPEINPLLTPCWWLSQGLWACKSYHGMAVGLWGHSAVLLASAVLDNSSGVLKRAWCLLCWLEIAALLYFFCHLLCPGRPHLQTLSWVFINCIKIHHVFLISSLACDCLSDR